MYFVFIAIRTNQTSTNCRCWCCSKWLKHGHQNNRHLHHTHTDTVYSQLAHLSLVVAPWCWCESGERRRLVPNLREKERWDKGKRGSAPPQLKRSSGWVVEPRGDASHDESGTGTHALALSPTEHVSALCLDTHRLHFWRKRIDFSTSWFELDLRCQRRETKQENN